MGPTKDIATILILILAVVIVVQNLNSAEFTILFVKVRMPNALLLALFFVAGYLFGGTVHSWLKRVASQ